MQAVTDSLSAVRDTAIALLDPSSVEHVPQGLERAMLASDKLPVVLAVVLIIWFGIVFLLLRTERRISRIEKALNEVDARA